MVNTQISNKKLKAIVFTDIVDFTKLSAEDEQHALNLIDKQREIVKPIVEKHNGEWLKEIGDGLLFSFDSSLDAVNCSIEIQQSLKDIADFKIRIGIHQGDIFIKDGDVFGDDVNIASRVEGFSPVGGIAISDKISKDIAGVKNIKVIFMGHKKIKGVGQDTRIYCIKANGLNVFRKQWFPLTIGWFLVLFSIMAITITMLSFLLDDLDPVSISRMVKGLIWKIAFFIFGYTNLMYVNGVSSKTHKYVVYTSYVALAIFIFSFYLAVKSGEIIFK